MPRWAERVAGAIPLLMLPVCLWRLPFGFGFTMGFVMGEAVQPPLWITIPYVLALSCLSELAAFLCFGLVRGWGEVLPDRVPFFGGRRLRPVEVLVPASVVALGANLLLVDWVMTVFRIAGRAGPETENAAWALLAHVVSGLFVLWGPLLTSLIWAYYVRRCR
ncbi:hypothetical protein OHS33_03995 [Streptomyces sp. NBC_00536]|uniref:hypothetical protein n=1 Tax=Streptomyces sp. NBC_00536 TaxID=2975769 RepID=UPI002E7FD4D6|nr:hypothetical protein [Streptomyces sp. NBC_00536]WUC77571.1 hypothetical protein OHS33_03995 [Streptomyces sp. NBC_00536]